ncbi:hypothetical protein GETHLI_19570 [Geothrix limicola]|uniref:Thioredoxin domain-containing protein n=1 Tax=Geothrix limicola TaxID=2927978 RepID=A0ABQ5QGD3_9BACT|nr:TlpA disulfide reductase family protein [Geothrix limicola]GLH73455.1 hypothetical protein GETHLI_19570 [Geothrix limicola]
MTSHLFNSRLAVALVAAGLLAVQLPAAESPKASPAQAQAVTLKVGDHAPALKVSRWVKGQPVEALKKGELYVVEFWATWCGPCKAAMPHLTELAKKYAGKVTFIGVNIKESGSPEAVDAKVSKFVEGMGDKMGYTVAQDTRDSFMDKTWMKAGGHEGIPQSFIVDREGRIVWEGHPTELDKFLEKIVAGTFKLQEAKADVAAVAQRAKEWETASKAFEPFDIPIRKALLANDWATALRLCDEAESKYPDLKRVHQMAKPLRIQALAGSAPDKVQPLLEKDFTEPSVQSYMSAAGALLALREKGRRWNELGLAYLDKAAALDTDKGKDYDAWRFPFLIHVDDARAHAIYEAAKAKDPQRANELINWIEGEGVSKAWLEIARVNLEEQTKNPAMGIGPLGNLAKVYFYLGRVEEAIQAQEKWISFLNGKKAPAAYVLDAEAALKKYQAAKK